MSHINDTITPCAGFAFEVTPEFRTTIIERRNKREHRNGEWEQVRHLVSAPYQNITRAMVLEIKRLFLVCRGNLHTFYFRDPTDYQAENEPFGLGDGVTTGFQLSKRSTADGVNYDREVYLPLAGEVITVNDVPTTAYELDYETGWVEFDAPLALNAVPRWTGEFNLKVRFVADRLPFTVVNRGAGQFLMTGSVDLLEVPE